jgi:hypothetical protein
MEIRHSAKHTLKLIRWQARRVLVMARYGPLALQKTPAVLGNAMPKSGSHLINQIVQGLTKLGPFVDPGFPPVNRDEFNEKLSDGEILRNLIRMRPADLAYGYIKARELFISLLTQTGRATIFVYRDPRDMIVSHVFYATDLHEGHGMHHYYTKTLGTMEERINAAIQGVEQPGSQLSSIRNKYEGYMGWLQQPSVLCLRFEDLILDRKAALARLLDYLEQRGFAPVLERADSIQVLEKAISPKKSGTFRKGQPGNWREHFTDANKEFFKENTGDLLVRWGYEKNDDW